MALSKHSHHTSARDWWAEQGASETIVFCRATQQSLLRLLTTTGLMQLYGIEPLTNQKAWRVHDDFCSDPRVSIVKEPPGVDSAWRTFASRRTSSPKLWMDAYLAAVATQLNATLTTTDRAFSQFVGLKVERLTKG